MSDLQLIICIISQLSLKKKAWILTNTWRLWESEDAKLWALRVYQTVSCLCHIWIMDELVIINPTSSGTAVWWSGGRAKGRTEHRKQPSGAGARQPEPDSRSPTAGARQPEREERARSLSEGKESEFEEEREWWRSCWGNRRQCASGALTRTGCLSLLRVSKFVLQHLVCEAVMELIRGFHNI